MPLLWLWCMPIVGLCHLWYAAATTMPDLSTPWCCHSMIYAVFFCGLHFPPFSAAWFSAVHCVDRRGRTTTTCDARRLPVRSSGIWQGQWHVAINIRLFCIFSMISQASSCGTCFQRLGFITPVLQSASICHIHTVVLTRRMICRV